MFCRFMRRIFLICILVVLSTLLHQKAIYANNIVYSQNELKQDSCIKDDGSYAKNEWVEWKYENGVSHWKYFNRFGFLVEGFFEVNGKMYYYGGPNSISMNSYVSGGRYYADESGALRSSKDGNYVKPFSSKKTISDVEGLPNKIEYNYSTDYQLLSERIINKENGDKTLFQHQYEYDQNGNLIKSKTILGDSQLLYTVEYTYDGRDVIKQEYKDASANIRLVRLLHYNYDKYNVKKYGGNAVDGSEWLRADGSSIVKYIDKNFYSGSLQDAYDEWENFIKDTCPEDSFIYALKHRSLPGF